jgi:hypothetical protein
MGLGRDVDEDVWLYVAGCGVHMYRRETDYPLTNAWIPIPVYPEDNWQLGIRLKIAAEQVSFAESIGEYRESAEAVKGLAGILTRAGHAARRVWRSKGRAGMIRTVKRELGDAVKPKTPYEWKDAIGMHLALTYGVTPQIGMVEDIFTQLNSVRSRRIRVVSTTQVEATKRYTNDYIGEAISQGRKSQRAIIYVTFADTHGNFTAGNLASSVWAGIPLSFVVDWAIDIGGYLESLTALSGVQSVIGTVTTKERLRTTSTLRPKQRLLVEPLVREYQSYKRDVVNQIPLPSRVRVRIPEWNFGKFVSMLEIFSSFRR